MKKVFALLLAAVSVLSLAACGNSYSDDEYARIWFLVCDPEEVGQFRKTFEQSISFAK